MNPPVYALLSAALPVTALVKSGTKPPRIFDGGYAPEGSCAPYIVWRVISELPQNYLSDLPDIDQQRVQIDCYAADRTAAITLADAARAALEPQGYQVSLNADARDFETQLYLISRDYEFWVSR